MPEHPDVLADAEAVLGTAGVPGFRKAGKLFQ